MNSLKHCRHCHEGMRCTARALAHHERNCPQNPVPPLPEEKPKWTCQACGKTIALSHKNRHVCPLPKVGQVREGMFQAAAETMRRNDRRKNRARIETQCPRCKQTPCQTLDACGRAIRAADQHARLKARLDAELGRKQTN